MSLDIERALITRFYDGNFDVDLEVAEENLPYEPTIGTPYVEYFVVPNDITPFSLKHSNETDGVFRLILRYPINESSITSKKKAHEIMDWFLIGSKYTYNGQTVRIMRSGREKGVAESGWYKTVITFYYKAFISR